MHTSGHGTLFSTVYESTYVVLPLVKYNYINHIHTKKKHVPQSSLFILEDCTTLLFYPRRSQILKIIKIVLRSVVKTIPSNRIAPLSFLLH